MKIWDSCDQRIFKHRLDTKSLIGNIPIASSRVENQATWDGLEILGRQRRIERMARSPWVRGCATPKTLRPPCRGDLKFGAP